LKRFGPTFLLLGIAMGGCGQASQTPLPELTRVSKPLMSPEDQAEAIRRLQAAAEAGAKTKEGEQAAAR
jgi:hypothetical protein